MEKKVYYINYGEFLHKILQYIYIFLSTCALKGDDSMKILYIGLFVIVLCAGLICNVGNAAFGPEGAVQCQSALGSRQVTAAGLPPGLEEKYGYTETPQHD